MKKMMILIFVFCLVSPAYSKILIGKVDIQKVLISTKQGKAVRGKLKKVFDKKQKELRAGEEQFRKAQEKLEKQAQVLNDKAKEKKRMEIQKMYMDLQNKSMAYQKEIQEMEQKEKTPILEKLKGIIENISKESKVDVTFESSTAPVIYARNEVDLTDKVIKAYDKKFPK